MKVNEINFTLSNKDKVIAKANDFNILFNSILNLYEQYNVYQDSNAEEIMYDYFKDELAMKDNVEFNIGNNKFKIEKHEMYNN